MTSEVIDATRHLPQHRRGAALSGSRNQGSQEYFIGSFGANRVDEVSGCHSWLGTKPRWYGICRNQRPRSRNVPSRVRGWKPTNAQHVGSGFDSQQSACWRDRRCFPEISGHAVNDVPWSRFDSRDVPPNMVAERAQAAHQGVFQLESDARRMNTRVVNSAENEACLTK